MIEAGLSIWALGNTAIQEQLGQSQLDVAQQVYSTFYYSFLPKQPTLPAIIFDRVSSREAADTLDVRTPAATMLEGRFQFGCAAQDAANNPVNASGYLSARELSRTLREQLLGLDIQGGFSLPDGTTIFDLWIVDEFDAHFEVGGMGYLYRRALQVGMLFQEPDVAYVPSLPGGGVIRYSFAPATDGTTTLFTATVAISTNALVVCEGLVMTAGVDYTYVGDAVTFSVAPDAGDNLALYQ